MTTAWLIELTDRNLRQPQWYHCQDGWKLDANEATWFVRKQDAESVANGFAPYTVTVTEHVFVDTALDAPTHPGVQYVRDCLRTESTPDFVRVKTKGEWDSMSVEAQHDRMLARLLHAVLGLMSEVGEIADALKKHLIYGKELDLVNLIEEVGDESWYQSLLLDAIGSTWQESWDKNIAKLKKRFGDKFTQAAALHRDLDGERAVLEEPIS